MNLRPTWMEVHLENIRHNYRILKSWIEQHGGTNARVFPVLKANAYGLGAIPIAWTLKQLGADYIIVATVDEALQLREAGIADPVLVLGAAFVECVKVCVHYGIRMTLTDLKTAYAISEEAVSQKTTAFVHIAIDTGMGRIGFLPQEASERVKAVSSLPGVIVEGIFTHFSTADEVDLSYAEKQHDTFVGVLRRIEENGLRIPIVHCCNSGATVNYPGWAMGGVRPGQLLVGMYPSLDVPRLLDLHPGFTLKTRVAVVRVLKKGEYVGYGRTYVTSSDETIAVLPIGYADGLGRSLSNNGDVLIRGKRCPIVGRVCMDQCMIRVDGYNNVEVGDEVVVIGRQGDAEITLDEYAGRLGCLVAQVGPAIGSRVPRVYTQSAPSGN